MSVLEQPARLLVPTTRETLNTPTLPSVRLYLMSDESAQQEFFAAVRSNGACVDRTAPLTWRLGSEQQVLARAKEAGLYRDTFASQLGNLAAVKNVPRERIDEFVTQNNRLENSTIVEFPWRTEGRFVRLLNHPEFREVIFSRNRFVFSDEALERLRVTLIACAGMGVGAGILESLVRMGAENLRFCDAGTAQLKDNNRLIGGTVHTIDASHAVHAARHYLEINPYVRIEAYDKYLGTETDAKTISIEDLVDGAGYVLEEIDNLAFKPSLRRVTHALGQVTITGTDTATAGSISWEQPEDLPFHGRVSVEDEAMLRDPKVDFRRKTALAVGHIVGEHLVSDTFKVAAQRASEAGAQYWNQPVISARVTAAIVTTAILLHMEGQEINRELMIDVAAHLKR